MKIVEEDSLQWFFDRLPSLISNVDESRGTYLTPNTEPYVMVGDMEDCNLQYCRDHNLKVGYIKDRPGGTFVISKGSVSLSIIRHRKESPVEGKLFNSFVEYLRDRGIPAYRMDNDILVEGYKVLGATNSLFRGTDCYFVGVNFSVNIDMELIKNICLKPMEKVPKALSDYGVTTEDVMEFCREFCEKLQ